MENRKKLKRIGGQAILDGVMMCTPQTMSVALRLSDGSISLHTSTWKGIFEKLSFVKIPFVRGVIVFLETVYNGMCALKISVLKESKTKILSEKTFYGSLFSAFTLVVGLFVFLPHFLTQIFVENSTLVGFQILDGFIKLALFSLYLIFIAQMDEVKRLFQFHGAEHKVIHAYEKGVELTVENAQKFSRIHPRCGTSFIILLLIVSLIFFMFFMPLASHLLALSPSGIELIFLKILFILPIAGIAYEFIQWSEKKADSFFLKLISKPGLFFQRLTTKEPSNEQIEVAIAALQSLL